MTLLKTVPRKKPQSRRITQTLALLLFAIPLFSATALSCEAKQQTARTNFYASVNARWLAENKKPPEGNFYWSSFTQVQNDNQKKSIAALDEAATKSYAKGTKEQRVTDFYRTGIDLARRNAQGLKPIAPYIAAYRNAKNIKELIEADQKTLTETGKSVLLSFAVISDANRFIRLAFSGPMPIGFDVYRPGKGKKAYLAYLARLFELSGLTPSDARSKAKTVYSFESQLAAVAMSAQERLDPSKQIDYPFYLFRTMYPDIDFKTVFLAMGLPIPESIRVYDQNIVEKSARFFTEDNRAVLALYAEARTLITFGSMLSEDFERAGDTFLSTTLGNQSFMKQQDWLKKEILMQESILLSTDLGRMYIDRWFSDDARRDIELMARRIIAEYRDEIESAVWIDPRTKKRALQKIDAMKINVGYSDVWDMTMENADIRGTDSGGDYFHNYVAVVKLHRQKNLQQLVKPFNREEWTVPVYFANTFYDCNLNEVFIPAGILQIPFYDKSRTDEQNLGAIGFFIAHEISHAFDNNGAQYDAAGKVAFWWTKADLEKYKQRCGKIRAFYDGIKTSAGYTNNGMLTLSENASDLMAMRCILALLGKKEHPDYKAFFVSYAETFRATGTSAGMKYLSGTNVHSLDEVRVNRTASNFREFADTFDIVKGDPMYVEPKDRVRIW